MSIESMLNPDPFEDLEVAARLADNTKHHHGSSQKLWPIPFTVVGERSSSGEEVDTREVTNFIFTFPRLSICLNQRNVAFQVKPGLPEGGRTISKFDRDQRTKWQITRWSRMAYLRRRVAEGFTPEDVARELRSVPQFITASTTCYRYGKYAGQATVLDGFAFGDVGLRRLRAQTKIERDEMRRRLWKEGMQGYFQSQGDNGSAGWWVVRQLRWTYGEDGYWRLLPDSEYVDN